LEKVISEIYVELQNDLCVLLFTAKFGNVGRKELLKCYDEIFLRPTAGTAIARLSRRNSVRLSVRPSVCPSVTRVDQVKTVQARIIKSSPSAAPKTLVSGSVTLFQKIHRGHPNQGP